jgi:hypothetical protein
VLKVISLALLTLFLAGCSYAGVSRREAIEAASEGAKQQAPGRLAVRHVLKRQTADGKNVWLVEFTISPRRVEPELGGRICALSFKNSSAYDLPTRTSSSTTPSRQPPRRASGQSLAPVRTSKRTCARNTKILGRTSSGMNLEVDAAAESVTLAILAMC